MSEELAQRWRHYAQTRHSDLRNALVIHYLPLVHYVAGRAIANAPPHQDRGDFVSWGYVGLIDAVEKFDPASNTNAGAGNFSVNRAFEAYAMVRVHGAILDGLRREDPLTRSVRRSVKETERAQESLQGTLGRFPSVEELAGYRGVDVADQRILMQAMRTLNTSLDAEPSDDGENVGSVLPNVRFDDPQLAAELSEAGEIMAVALARLPERERVFAALYYFHQLTLTQIGSELGISESRVGQIRLGVIQALRQG